MKRSTPTQDSTSSLRWRQPGGQTHKAGPQPNFGRSKTISRKAENRDSPCDRGDPAIWPVTVMGFLIWYSIVEPGASRQDSGKMPNIGSHTPLRDGMNHVHDRRSSRRPTIADSGWNNSSKWRLIASLFDSENDQAFARAIRRFGDPDRLVDPIDGNSMTDLGIENPSPDEVTHRSEELQVLRDVTTPHEVAQPETFDVEISGDEGP